jgi:transglutaminase-like putative cysteine protease
MKYLTVHHLTRYRYAKPVTLGRHRLMLRPRDSHDLRLVDSELTLSPPGETLWMHDVFGNSVAEVAFTQRARELLIVSTLSIERYGLACPVFPIALEAQMYPFVYLASDRSDLGRLMERHYPDPQGKVDAWAKRFVGQRPMSTYDLLSNINGAIKNEFTYYERYVEGTQSPTETLEKKGGACRDYALLFIEVMRNLGFGARFITGYLYDRALDSDAMMQGSGATHAWADVYLPGAGWVEFDPTNGLIAGENLIRVAVTRDPSQAIPISGTFTGAGSDFLGFAVEVEVSRRTQPFNDIANAVKPYNKASDPVDNNRPAQPAIGSPASSIA